MATTLPALAIVGPTATGKSEVATALAGRVPGVELVSADAMAVYRGMDIGTAKPGAPARAAVPHHLLDVADPDEEYAVARFQDQARAAVDDIETRGGTVVVVGGTGLYVRALIDDFTVPGRYPEARRSLEADADTGALWRRLEALDPVAAAKVLPTNRRRIVRALEVTIGAGRPFSSFGPGVDAYGPTRYRLAGLAIDRHELDRRIDERIDRQLSAGWVQEVERLRAELGPGGWSRTAGQALGYRELSAHLDGLTSLDEAVEEVRQRTKRFARRQQRWFRRDPRITWFDALTTDLVDRIQAWWGNSEADPAHELRHWRERNRST